MEKTDNQKVEEETKMSEGLTIEYEKKNPKKAGHPFSCNNQYFFPSYLSAFTPHSSLTFLPTIQPLFLLM